MVCTWWLYGNIQLVQMLTVPHTHGNKISLSFHSEWGKYIYNYNYKQWELLFAKDTRIRHISISPCGKTNTHWVTLIALQDFLWSNKITSVPLLPSSRTYTCNNRLLNIAYASCNGKLLLLSFETVHSLTYRNKCLFLGTISREKGGEWRC